jgi:hypothetical protein
VSDSETVSRATASFGFFPVVAGDEVAVRQAGTTAVFAGEHATFERAGSNAAFVGGNLSISRGGVNFLLAGGDVAIEQGGAVVMAARAVRAERAYVGAVLSPKVELADSKILFSTTQAAAFGGALGAAIVIVARLLRRS